MSRLIGRSIPAFVVAEALAECINIASEAGETNVLRKLIEVADDMSLIRIDSRDSNGDATTITWVSQRG